MRVLLRSQWLASSSPNPHRKYTYIPNSDMRLSHYRWCLVALFCKSQFYIVGGVQASKSSGNVFDIKKRTPLVTKNKHTGRHNSTSNTHCRKRSSVTTGFVHNNKGISSNHVSTRRNKFRSKSLQMSTSSRSLRRDFDAINAKPKNLKAYSLFNHQQQRFVSSIAMRQALRDDDIETKIKNYRGGGTGTGTRLATVEKVRDNETSLPSSIRVEDIVSPQTLTERFRSRLNQIDIQDAAVIVAYASTQFAISLPVILIPTIAADPFAPGVVNTLNSAEFLGAIVSLSTLGAGVGKLINGFVCQAIGGKASGSLYLLGLSIFSIILSSTYSIHGYAIAGMEFCASMLWTASSVLMAERYASDGKKFTAGIMSLSLASTTGTIIAKLVGGALLSQYHWRQVTLLSALVAAFGSAILYFFRDEQVVDVSTNPNTNASTLLRRGTSSTSMEISKGSELDGLSIRSIGSSISNVLGNRMYFAVAIAHFAAFITRSGDKVVGAFIADATALPRYLCGTLTTSMTLGFVLGLVTGRGIEDLDKISEKKSFLSKRYGYAVLSALAMAVCANKDVGSMLGQYGLAAAITLFSGTLAASVGFQFYQLPARYAPSFGKDKAVYISFTDGFCFLLLSPFWSTITNLVAKYPEQGWTYAWSTVAVFSAVGGSIMINNLPKVLRLEEGNGKDK